MQKAKTWLKRMTRKSWVMERSRPMWTPMVLGRAVMMTMIQPLRLTRFGRARQCPAPMMILRLQLEEIVGRTCLWRNASVLLRLLLLCQIVCLVLRQLLVISVRIWTLWTTTGKRGILLIVPK